MNILIYSKPYWPSIGGVESGSRLLARSLAESGHRVKVFTSTVNHGSELDEGYRVYRSANLFTFVRAASGVDLLLMKGGVSAFAGLGAILAGVPAVMIWHEMAGPYEHPGKTFKVRATNFVRKRIAERSCAHVGVSRACLESKCLFGGMKRCIRRVIYNPISNELAAAAASFDTRHPETDVLFVGRLIEGKGIFVLAEACRILDREGCPLRIRIVGDGGDRGRMETSLQDVRTLSVTFEGSQEGATLARSYASARVLVVPSTNSEGMGLVVVEGMAFGLPVVASDQAALKEVVGDAGVIVRNGDAEALASALRTLLRDQDQWKQLSDRARQRSELFSMANFRQGIADLIGEVATHCQS